MSSQYATTLLLELYAKQVLNPELDIVESKKSAEESGVFVKEVTALTLKRMVDS